MQRYQYITRFDNIIDANGYLDIYEESKSNAKQIITTLFDVWTKGLCKMNKQKVDKFDVYPNIKKLIDAKYITINQAAKIAKQYGVSKAVLQIRLNDLNNQ
jgi:hypothetical protein